MSLHSEAEYTDWQQVVIPLLTSFGPVLISQRAWAAFKKSQEVPAPADTPPVATQSSAPPSSPPAIP
jgi:hypothetical protein